MKFIIGLLCYMSVGVVLGSLNIDFHNWQTWAIFAVMAVNEVNESYHARNKAFDKATELVKEAMK